MKEKKGGLANVKNIKAQFKDTSKPKQNEYKHNYSREEVIKKIDTMARVAKEKKDKDDMLKIKDRWYKHHHDLQVNRGIQKEHLRRSINKGMADPASLDRVENNFKITDQNNRNKTMKAAKNYYHRNYSMSKHFKMTQPKSKEVNKDNGPELNRE